MAVELCMTYGECASTNPPKEKEEEEKAHEMAVAAATDKAINHSVTAPFATALHRRLLLYYIHYTHIQTEYEEASSLVDARKLQYMAAAVASSSASSLSSSSSSSLQWLVE